MDTLQNDNQVDLRRFAGQFPTGVAVITTADNDNKLHGLTMSAVTSLSLTPPLFLICLNNTSNTLTAIKQSGHFGINFLSSDQANICKIFASKAEDKFGTVAHTFGPAGSPLIDGALAHGECLVQSTIGEGDHTIVVARLVHTEVRDVAPLVYHAGKLTALAEAVPA
ncbi:flavin reductase family protein [Pigmentiphaga litoralis]|uniref:Flavin reductase (DIM6/NTAB) family NADH-FMN oxidoreductase RutF n=1 Tax=Pigmentiphaga litoralis TaxID=516702 RepID=A0A7Y9IRP1_9BURK|nr:flavin reductase family protein [Pigmentiphaga litoralis]NYE24609.1 flavin reductase (DIM6/NTAB) family NADH-FMN oxidoreductase RutF [Pigmentiphaga litoralis]NYE81777.1 flavin reductase (DIM6/NTAB) family NADH-FMN oxidoreductase RutF [Pigmentiphaga litoralis]